MTRCYVRRRRLPLTVQRIRTALCLLLAAAALAAGCARPPAEHADDGPPDAPIPGVSPLAPGSPLPHVDAEGWVNGPPPAPGPGGPRLLVVDVLALW